MSRQIKKVLSLLLVVAMVLSMAACGGASKDGDTASNKQIDLKFVSCYVGTESKAAIIKTLIDEFNAANTGKIKVENDGVPEYANALNKIKTSMAANQAVDIFSVQESILTKDFWGAGKLADLTKYIDDEFKGYKNESEWAEATIDGKTMGVPFVTLLIGMYYNKDIFAKAGVTEVPKTWDEMLVACDKIKQIGIAPFSMQTLGTGWTSMLLYSTMAGSNIGGNDYIIGASTFEKPEFIDSAKLLLKLKDYTTNDALGGQYDIAINNFMVGKTAMVANGPWMVGDMKKNAEFYKNVGVMPYPSNGKGQTVIAGPCLKLCSSALNEKDPEKMKAIASFLKFVSSTENTKRMALASGETFTGKIEYSEADKLEPLTQDLYNLKKSVPFTVLQMRDSLPSTFATAFEEELANLWTGKATPEQFCKNLSEKTFK